jgi:hypothetical protein
VNDLAVFRERGNCKRVLDLIADLAEPDIFEEG